MKLFWRYVKQKRHALLFYGICEALYFAAFALYGLPFAAFWYPSAVCAFVGMVFLAAGFVREKEKHAVLERLKKGTAAMIETLPVPQSIEEADYTEILTVLRTETNARTARDAEKYRDMIQYYTVWAHQIKTPIAAMKLILECEDTAFSRRLASELFRIEQYVEMVLAFVRLDGGNDYVFKEYALDEIVKGTIRKYASEFIGRHIACDYKPTGVRVVTDEKWLSFVIGQVLSNALKYTPSGKIGIRVEEMCTLVITDTGIGIEKSDLPRVCELGFTGGNGRLEGRSSGVGLYLCKRVCDKLGIGIKMSSEVGKGTTVRLDLARKNVTFE